MEKGQHRYAVVYLTPQGSYFPISIRGGGFLGLEAWMGANGGSYPCRRLLHFGGQKGGFFGRFLENLAPVSAESLSPWWRWFCCVHGA